MINEMYYIPSDSISPKGTLLTAIIIFVIAIFLENQ